MVDITLVLAVLGGITAFAGAIKSIPYIWGWLKKTGQVIDSIDQIPKIDDLTKGQQTIKDKLNDLSTSVDELKGVSSDIPEMRKIVQDFNDMAIAMSDNAVSLTITAFKAYASRSETPCYVMSTSSDGMGQFLWANDAWYNLLGIDYIEARNGAFWESIAPEDRDRAHAASTNASRALSEFKITYVNVNQRTKETKTVLANAWPLVSKFRLDDDVTVYLGCIAEL